MISYSIMLLKTLESTTDKYISLKYTTVLEKPTNITKTVENPARLCTQRKKNCYST